MAIPTRIHSSITEPTIFNENELALLRRLKPDPHWQSILKRIKDFGKIPEFRPKGQEDQESNWKYASGQSRAYKSVYLTLSLSKTGDTND